MRSTAPDDSQSLTRFTPGWVKGSNSSLIFTWGEHRAYFHKEGEHLISVPATWTDLVAEDPVVRLGAGRSLFRAGDLLELARLVERLPHKGVKEITP